MKKLLRAFCMCLSMFSVLPVPGKVWDEEARSLMTLCLPAVGLLLGGLWALLAVLCRALALPGPVSAAALCAYPFLITGGIHFDGYLDVTDAVKSCRDLEERRRILKDPHAGSFAVLAGVLLVMVQFALFSAAGKDAELLWLVWIPLVSRTVSALAVTVLRPMSGSEYAGLYRRGVKRSHVLFLSGLLAAELAGGLLCGKGGLTGPAVLAGYCHHLWRGFRALDGMSGDISGYALTFAEACGVAVLVLL